MQMFNKKFNTDEEYILLESKCIIFLLILDLIYFLTKYFRKYMCWRYSIHSYLSKYPECKKVKITFIAKCREKQKIFAVSMKDINDDILISLIVIKSLWGIMREKLLIF